MTAVARQFWPQNFHMWQAQPKNKTQNKQTNKKKNKKGKKQPQVIIKKKKNEKHQNTAMLNLST